MTRRRSNPVSKRRSTRNGILDWGSRTTYRRSRKETPGRQQFDRYETYQGYGYRRRPGKTAAAESGVTERPKTKKQIEREQKAADRAEMEVLNSIARGQGAKSFKSLSGPEKEMVRGLAARFKNPFRPPIRSTAKSALHLYDQGVRTAYDWTAGLPSRIAHSLLENPMHEHHEGCGCHPNPPHVWVTYASPTDALGRKRPGWYVMDHNYFTSRHDTKEEAERNAAALWQIRGGHGPWKREVRENPRRTSGRYLPPGTRIIINDNLRINAAATIVKWGQTVHPLYKTPETALVRMERTGSLQEVPIWAISLPEGERGWPKGSSYSPNPRRNPESGADRMYEVFHGRAPETDVIIEEEIHEHEHLATLGKMVSLKVETRSGYMVEIGWDDKDFHPYLACNEQGNQLYIEGGDQHIDLAEFKMDGQKWRKDMMVIGDLVEITYRTEKDFDHFETIDYYHANGEESGEVPQLIYDPNSKADRSSRPGKMYIAGGKYRIEHDGIID